jgi:hypothetical protein
MAKITTNIKNAGKLLDWINTRGGVAVWKSIDLSNPGAESFTPAITDGKPTNKPHWRYSNEPSIIITDPNEIEVTQDEEVRRFHIAVRRGCQGFVFKLTDASTRKVHVAVEKAGESAYYEFNYSSQECLIMKPTSTMPLSQYKVA